MSTIPNKNVLRHLLRAPVYLYRWRLGPLFGKRFLLLTHTGRRTGVRHQTVLEVMEYREEGPEAVVMSGFGPQFRLASQYRDNPERRGIGRCQTFPSISSLSE
jgi:hypothetical protein